MKIGEIFKKEITRPIKGVITVGGSESTDEIKQELEEYVVTREILKHMRTLYTNYGKSLVGYLVFLVVVNHILNVLMQHYLPIF